MKKYSLLVIFILGTFFVFQDAYAATSYTRIFYYRQSPAAQQDFFNHANAIDVLAPQTYSFTASGTLVGSTSPAIRVFAAAHNIRIMPLVTNGAFSQQVTEALLDNPIIENVAIAALVTEAKKEHYWGWQIDFEPMNALYRQKFSAFVANAATILHTNGLILSVAVVAHTSDRPADYPAGFWQSTAGVFDYTTLAKSADFLSIMSYDDPLSHGPVVAYPWLKKVVAYALTHVPAAKISLGIPLYYWQWNNRTGRRIGIGGATTLARSIKEHAKSAQFGYSSYEAESFVRFGYTTIWYENARSIATKIALIKKAGLAGFSAWRLGLEPSAIYTVVEK